MSVHSLKMTTVRYIRKLLGKSSCATNNLLHTGHKTQKSTSDYKLTKNTERYKQDVVQPQDKTAEQCIRRDVILRREENETFGFDIQTSSGERTLGAEQDVSSCVCWVKENSSAMGAGLTTGDVIITVNGVYITGCTHQEINDLMEKSTMLKMEIIRDSTVKQRQLLGKLYLLQRELTEKCEELQTIIKQDVRLSRGVLENN
ncbi:General receptor for phosphoinositides 1-associated scaffold protein [Triplophysa tibetana]|uniref:General receptor for phosphoinositides 1-associated scaffold protein n=1 Tax=Triplophysa tibetana TaxID=1572043 RepID=A0A5A9NWS5_9TELE|nr:General receptor for phosphoinositides 1-associated scaffold protein [Triplophysa tibetana]